MKSYCLAKNRFRFVELPQVMQRSAAQEAVFARLFLAVPEAFGFLQGGGVVPVTICGHDRIHRIRFAQGTSHSSYSFMAADKKIREQSDYP